LESPFVVHGQLADLGPQPGDLLVAIVDRPALQRGLTAGQEVVAPAGEGGGGDAQLAGEEFQALAPEEAEDGCGLARGREAAALAGIRGVGHGCGLLSPDTDIVPIGCPTESRGGGDPGGASIEVAMAASPDGDFRISTVRVYEMLGGAINLIHDLRKKRKDLVPGFRLLRELFENVGIWQGRILWCNDAFDRVHRGFIPRLRQELKNDARIAAVALRHGAAVRTCNIGDYKRVPGLIVYAAEPGIGVS
jgi:predicted nucleic acid-binding protein